MTPLSEVLRVIPLLESLERRRVKTDWLDEQVSRDRGGAKCPRAAEGAVVGWISWKCSMSVQIQSSEFDTI